MTSRLGSHFKAARLAKGLTLESMAGLTGYRDRRKVAARIAHFEQDGTVKEELLSRLADALDIDLPTIEGLLACQDASPASYVLQRRDNGHFLTAKYLRWSKALQDAQRCDLEEGKSIQGWLAAIGIMARISKIDSR